MGQERDSETGDSLLRAIAHAPALQPPPRAERRRVRSPRILGYVAAAIAIAAVFGGLLVAIGWWFRAEFRPTGQLLSRWTLAGPRAETVTLPAEVPHGAHPSAPIVLQTEVSLTPAQRGQPLTLMLVCFHGALAATVDGATIPESGETTGGEHRYVIDAARTDRPALQLALVIPPASADIAVAVVPQLLVGVAPHSAAAAFNRKTTVAAIVLAGFAALFYGVLFALDRRYREYLALTIMGLSAAMLLLWLYESWPGVRVVTGLTFATSLPAALVFQYRALRIRPPSRWWFIAWGADALLVILGPTPADLLLGLLALATYLYLFARYVRVAFVHEYRHDARLLIAGYLPNFAVIGLGIVMHSIGADPLYGAHPAQLAVCALMLAGHAVVARQFVARQRTIEYASAELQRLVAEKSRQLADALAQLAHQQAPTVGPGASVDDRYKVVRRLGAGGLGTVYEVERVADSRRFALKMLHKRADEQSLSRFAREAEIAAGLSHPNLVPVVDVGVTAQGIYLVMELVQGTSLAQLRDRFGNAAFARPLLAQIARGLAALHASGIVHRDLTPANILVAEGVARIADFGLSSIHRDATALDSTLPAVTRAGDVFGTPAYMAPELADGTLGAPASSDIFSFGVIASELLVGRYPFPEPPVVARMYGRAPHHVPLDGIDGALRRVIERTMAAEPMARPTAAELVALLD